MKFFALLLAFSGVAFAQTRDAQHDFPFTWREQPARTSAPPTGIDTRVLEAIAAFGPWAEACNYRIDVESHGRAVFLSPRVNSIPADRLAKIEATIDLFDRLLPKPPAAPATVAVAPKKKESESVNEDPEGAPPVVIVPKSDKPTPPPDAEAPTADSASEVPFVADARAPVLISVRNASDYARLLDRLDDLEPYLQAWVSTAKNQAGFVLERPLVGAFLLAPPDTEEWNPDNELVHRAMRVLALGRFSQQPYWLAISLAWFAEFEIEHAVYCFPNREGFVGVGDHTGWATALEQLFSERAEKPLKLAEFAAWKRGTYDDATAKIAWGVTNWLATVRPADLARMHEEFRALRDQRNRVVLSGGKWVRNPSFELSLEDQSAVLSRLLGETWLEALTRRFRRAAN